MTAPACEPSDCPVLQAILALLLARTGLEIPSKLHGSSVAAIRRAMLRTSARSMTEFHAMLSVDAGTFDALVDELTVGETYFFRDDRQFALLRERIIPAIARKGRPDQAIAVWSAGCSSGEEPYSIAILLDELGLAADARVIGTDLSMRRLNSARAGKYSRWSLRGVAPAIIHRYFRRSAAGHELAPAIRSAVRFTQLNLAEPFPPAFSPARFQLIVCRNVLIYFDAPTIARVVQRFADALADGGWLLLGPSDPPVHSPEWEVILTDAGLVYRRRPRTSTSEKPSPVQSPLAALPFASDSVSATPHSAVQQARVPSASTCPADAEMGRAHIPARPPAAPAARSSAGAPDASAPDAAALVAAIRDHANAGRSSAGALACVAALEAHPVSAELHLLSAMLIEELGDAEAAVSAAMRAIYIDARCIMAHVALGSALVRAGAGVAARRSFHNAMRLLDTMQPLEIVPASGGETVATIRGIVRTRLRLIEGAR